MVEGAKFKAVQKDTSLHFIENKDGIIKEYKVLWALGGKNVYYFLTEWEGGRLQTLPLAYDVKTKKWYNNPESAIRHFPQMNQGGTQDSALSWRDRQYTFNTSCYGCHVSQLQGMSRAVLQPVVNIAPRAGYAACYFEVHSRENCTGAG